MWQHEHHAPPSVNTEYRFGKRTYGILNLYWRAGFTTLGRQSNCLRFLGSKIFSWCYRKARSAIHCRRVRSRMLFAIGRPSMGGHERVKAFHRNRYPHFGKWGWVPRFVAVRIGSVYFSRMRLRVLGDVLQVDAEGPLVGDDARQFKIFHAGLRAQTFDRLSLAAVEYSRVDEWGNHSVFEERLVQFRNDGGTPS